MMNSIVLHRWKLMVIATFVVLLISCDKPAPVIEFPDYYWGEMRANINGEEWTADPYAAERIVGEKHFFTLIGDVFDVYWHVERLSIIFIPLSLGQYEVGHWGNDSIPFFLFTLLDEDVALGYYLVEGDQTPKGLVTISEYDEDTKELKGTFEGVIYKKQKSDSLVITDGYFHTRIYN